MDLKGKSIILASNSPRRRELLAGLDIEFTVDTRNTFEENYVPNTPHEKVPALMSEGKSMGFWRELEENEILITSDTMVLCGDKIMGKPQDREDAIKMIKSLSGREHHVITAVTVRDKNQMKTVCDKASVWFKDLTDKEIEYYIEKYGPFDKAGAYGIQEWIGYIGITKIEGSFFNIMGLPVHVVYSLLSDFIGSFDS